MIVPHCKIGGAITVMTPSWIERLRIASALIMRGSATFQTGGYYSNADVDLDTETLKALLAEKKAAKC